MSEFDTRLLQQSFKQKPIDTAFVGLYESLGMLAAIASSPEKIKPSEWVEQIKNIPNSTPEFENEFQLKNFTTQLATWWDYCTTHFDNGELLVLPQQIGLTATGKPNKALKEFAQGYLKGYDWLSTTWEALLPDEDNEAKRSLLVLNLILGRFVNEKAVAASEVEIYSQLPDIAGCFQALPSLISAVGMLGHDLSTQIEEKKYKKQVIEKTLPFRNKNKTIGRNDLCPCGSGKKFKKCCLH